MKKVVTGFVLVLVSYILFLLALTPANFALSKTTLPPQVNIKNLTGSVWNASAEQVSYNGINLHNVDSSLSVFSLIMFTPSVDVNFGQSTAKGPDGELSIAVDGNNIQLTNVDINLKAQDILHQVNLNLPIDAKGSVNLSIDEMTLAGQTCQSGAGKINWSKASVNAYKEQIDIGGLTADLKCETGKLVVIIDENNIFGLNYKAVLDARGLVSGEGFIKPPANFPEKLKPMLSLISKPDSQGRYLLKF